MGSDLTNQDSGSQMEWNAAHCPFCGVDAVSEDFCKHLIADFGDGTDGDRGIMCGSGGSRSGNAALDCLADIERTLIDFAEAVSPSAYLDEGLTEVEKASLIQALGFGDRAPSWLGLVLDDMQFGERPNQRTVESIWSTAVPWSDRLVGTSSRLGTMASTMVTFVWAADPDEGANQIAIAMRDVDQQIRAAMEHLASSGWRRDTRWTHEQQRHELERLVAEFLSVRHEGRCVYIIAGRLEYQSLTLRQRGSSIDGEVGASPTEDAPPIEPDAVAALGQLGFTADQTGMMYRRNDLPQDPTRLTELAAEVLRAAYSHGGDDYMVQGWTGTDP
jgi:hypothetical protein